MALPETEWISFFWQASFAVVIYFSLQITGYCIMDWCIYQGTEEATTLFWWRLFVCALHAWIGNQTTDIAFAIMAALRIWLSDSLHQFSLNRGSKTEAVWNASCSLYFVRRLWTESFNAKTNFDVYLLDNTSSSAFRIRTQGTTMPPVTTLWKWLLSTV